MAVVAGSADPTVPYGGGRVADWGSKKRGFVASVDSLFSFWAAQDGCASTSAGDSRQGERGHGSGVPDGNDRAPLSGQRGWP